MAEKELREQIKQLKKDISKVKKERDKARKELEKKITITDVFQGVTRSIKEASDELIDLEMKDVKKKKRPYTQSYQVGDVEIELKAVFTDSKHVKLGKKEEGEEVSTIKFNIRPEIAQEE